MTPAATQVLRRCCGLLLASHLVRACDVGDDTCSCRHLGAATLWRLVAGMFILFYCECPLRNKNDSCRRFGTVTLSFMLSTGDHIRI
ncbi:hypothetical protein IW261DRAFT_1506069 [Armillaria novae-zelandiae]|uniref:Secreted protein n=1 Tax=Armillaria novae-zelandiae TaxID=153914 RepID=A0AA39NW58_9AGAR|nr:hypothetical protein IW261DRAFT_1506069 [Armillaria novae-zelandiae]